MTNKSKLRIEDTVGLINTTDTADSAKESIIFFSECLCLCSTVQYIPVYILYDTNVTMHTVSEKKNKVHIFSICDVSKYVSNLV